MKIFFIGDIYGRSGRDAINAHLPAIKSEFSPDLIIANADNASHGVGVTPGIVKDLYAAGIDIVTGGDHALNQKELIPHLDREPWVLRPLNYPEGTPGKGWHIVETKTKKKVLVIHALGRTYIGKLCDDPFATIDKILQKHALGKSVDAIFVDFHAEATSEKNALGVFLDGRVSAVVGTHTHIPTADARIQTKGTAYMTDAGMTGDYNGIIGADAAQPLQYFKTGLKLDRYKPAEGEGTLCGVFIETDDATGLAVKITPIKRGGALV